MTIVRYADDIVVGFQHETDARRFWDAMRERLQEFALSLHPQKTRLIEVWSRSPERIPGLVKKEGPYAGLHGCTRQV
jgi:RNA-directed DNA polymerase